MTADQCVPAMTPTMRKRALPSVRAGHLQQIIVEPELLGCNEIDTMLRRVDATLPFSELELRHHGSFMV